MEALQRMSEAPLTDCPACGETGLRKLISAAAFRLKGEGWYETDFKGDKDQQLNLSKSDDKPADKDSTKEDKKDGGKSDSNKQSSKSGDKQDSKRKEKAATKTTGSQAVQPGNAQ